MRLRYKQKRVSGRRLHEHQLIAEMAMGKQLPMLSVIHHVDGNPENNTNSNLVVCQDAAYHKLLHLRQGAFNACGNVNWRMCAYCREYDSPTNMYIRDITPNKRSYHNACRSKHRRELKLMKGRST